MPILHRKPPPEQPNHRQFQEFPQPERGGASRPRVIDEAKAKVATIDLADLLCGPGQMRRVGKPWVGRCPLPDHEDRSPSFAVYPDSDSFYCFGCLRGGDQVDLAALAWGYSEDEMAGAAAHLLDEFGYKIPEQPPAFFAKQERQRDTRAAIEQVRKNILRRRIFKYCVVPMLEHIQDPEEYAKEARRAWRDLKEMLP